MDIIEVIGALLGIIYVALQYKANLWMWVSSLLMSLLYIYINYANGLYANFVLQIIFAAMAVVGLLHWMGFKKKATQRRLRLRAWMHHNWRGRKKDAPQRPITSMPRHAVVPIIAATLLLALATYAVLCHTGESSMPIFDSITVAINLSGTYMLIRKYYQEWICWMIVDPLMAVMYAMLGLWPSALLYAVFSIVVVFGYFNWRRLAQQNNNHDNKTR